jgi:uncharacterized protein (DUF2062 family)
MRKILLRRLLPFTRSIRGDRKLSRIFGRLLHDPNLWHLNRYSVAWGVSVGLFMAFVPVPFQMLLAIAAAVMISANIPVAVVLVWVSNPITVAPLFFAAYKFGAWLLAETPEKIKFEISIDWVVTQLVEIWQPFLLGCFVLGLASAAIGHAAVRIIWRIHVVQSWQLRGRRLMERRMERTGPLPKLPKQAQSDEESAP